ncbi:MAG: hypothetical protein D6796_16210 [Caldilineae bacterium]|nr:MAG: hypothetical protein D6796_16210 [Caldilineae bacterium]
MNHAKKFGRFSKPAAIRYNQQRNTPLRGGCLMQSSKKEQAALFLLGAAFGTALGLMVAVLFSPRSGPETRAWLRTQGSTLKARAVSEGDEFAQRIRAATDAWVSQLQAVADDLVAQGRLTAEEARAQIDDLLAKVRG